MCTLNTWFDSLDVPFTKFFFAEDDHSLTSSYLLFSHYPEVFDPSLPAFISWPDVIHYEVILEGLTEILHLDPPRFTRHVAVFTEDDYGLILEEVQVFGEGKEIKLCLKKFNNIYY